MFGVEDSVVALTIEDVKFTIRADADFLAGADIDVVPLSPAFITQGGPGALAIQYVMV